ncbi:MAG: DUF2155 domain-containing protein [Pseudomonadota bacterium]|nr:DUF2155 domain-containing protein [Pseudomonadota bacterium]
MLDKETNRNQTCGFIIRTVFITGLILGINVGSWASPQTGVEWPSALLQGLDKITARVSTIEAPLGLTVRFGTLDIVVKRCHKRPPEEPPETTAYIEIRERRQGENTQRLFSGWMFGSSPAVSAIEHPVYDVWVVDCIKVSSSE